MDSVIALFRVDFNGRGELSERTNLEVRSLNIRPATLEQIYTQTVQTC